MLRPHFVLAIAAAPCMVTVLTFCGLKCNALATRSPLEIRFHRQLNAVPATGPDVATRISDDIAGCETRAGNALLTSVIDFHPLVDLSGEVGGSKFSVCLSARREGA